MEFESKSPQTKPLFDSRKRESISSEQAFNLCTEPKFWQFSLKEVIQPHLPIGLPCYDFIPVISLTLGTSPLAVESATSGKTNFHDVTGGVYKARERIHGTVADAPLLAIPTSCSRVADYNLNWGRLYGICSPSRVGCPLYRPL